MNTRIKANAWIYYSIVILGFMAFVSALAAMVLTWMGHPVPDVIIIQAFLAIAGLGRLLISPLNQELFE